MTTHYGTTKKGDGFCEGIINNAVCDWDGGDCCPSKCSENVDIENWSKYWAYCKCTKVFEKKLPILNTIFIPVMLKELSLSLAETANRADSGQLQFWYGPSEILNLRSSNTPEPVALIK